MNPNEQTKAADPDIIPRHDDTDAVKRLRQRVAVLALEAETARRYGVRASAALNRLAAKWYPVEWARDPGNTEAIADGIAYGVENDLAAVAMSAARAGAKMADARPIRGDALADLWLSQSQWSQATFGPDRGDPVGALTHLRSEVDEALAEFSAIPPAKRGDKLDARAIAGKGEIVDCLLLTLEAARRAGMSLALLLGGAWDKHAINRRRTWAKDQASGFHRHTPAADDGTTYTTAGVEPRPTTLADLARFQREAAAMRDREPPPAAAVATPSNPRPAGKPGHYRIDVAGCSACGGRHVGVEVKPMGLVIVGPTGFRFTHVGQCPLTGDPFAVGGDEGEVGPEPEGAEVVTVDPEGTPPACDVCGAITVRSGNCWRCLGCGNAMIRNGPAGEPCDPAAYAARTPDGMPNTAPMPEGATVAPRPDPAAFKAYVHDRLDAMGVPADPDPERTRRTGCRIGSRLDVLGAALTSSPTAAPATPGMADAVPGQLPPPWEAFGPVEHYSGAVAEELADLLPRVGIDVGRAVFARDDDGVWWGRNGREFAPRKLYTLPTPATLGGLPQPGDPFPMPVGKVTLGNPEVRPMPDGSASVTVPVTIDGGTVPPEPEYMSPAAPRSAFTVGVDATAADGSVDVSGLPASSEGMAAAADLAAKGEAIDATDVPPPNIGTDVGVNLTRTSGYGPGREAVRVVLTVGQSRFDSGRYECGADTAELVEGITAATRRALATMVSVWGK